MLPAFAQSGSNPSATPPPATTGQTAPATDTNNPNRTDRTDRGREFNFGWLGLIGLAGLLGLRHRHAPGEPRNIDNTGPSAVR